MGKQLVALGVQQTAIPTYGAHILANLSRWNLLIDPLGVSLQGFPKVISHPRLKR